MDQHKCLKQVVTEKLKYFCKHSTLHGLIYFYERHHWFVYTTWCLIIALNVVLWVYLSNMIMMKYTVDPTFTVVESSRYPTSNIPFPSILLCDSEIVYGPKTKNTTQIFKLRGYETKQIEAFYKSFREIKEDNYTIDPSIMKMHNVLHDLGFTYIKLLDILNKPCDVLLVHCSWRSRSHNCTEMFREVFTYMGFCCQFDIPYFMTHTSDDETNFISGVETTEALRIMVNGQKVTADGTQYNGHITMFILDQHHDLTITDNSIEVSPGGVFDINLYVWSIDSAYEVKALRMAHRKCILSSDPSIWPRYYQGCISQLILQKTVLYCRCLPFNYTFQELHVSEFPRCTWERMKCIYDTMRQMETKISDLAKEGDCMVNCDYVQYDTETEYTKQSREFSKINGNYSHVSVHFTSDFCMKYRREVLYTWDQMLANLGGIFGLCVGGSVISIIELLWFTVDLIFTVLSTLSTIKKAPKKTNKVFTISEKDFDHKIFVRKNKRIKVREQYPFVN